MVLQNLKVLERKERNRLIDLLCLKMLAIDGTDWAYDIYNKLRVRELPKIIKAENIDRKSFKFYFSSVDRSFDRLEKQGFVKKEEHSTKSKRGPPKFPCHLTLLGLLHALEFRKELWGRIDDIAEKHADRLPLIFGEWKYFSERGVKNKVIVVMQSFCKAYVPRMYTSDGFVNYDEKSLREDLTRTIFFFYLDFITLQHLIKTPDQMRQQIIEREKTRAFDWIRVWLSNEKLKQYMTEELDEDERENRNRLKSIRLVRRYIRDLESARAKRS